MCIKFKLLDNSNVFYKQDTGIEHLETNYVKENDRNPLNFFLRCQESACATVRLQAVRTCKLRTGSRKKVINKCTKDKNRNCALSSKK